MLMEKEKAEIMARVIDCLDGVEYGIAKEVLHEAAHKLDGYAVIVSDARLTAGDYEALQKENAVLKRQLEEQRSDLLEFAQAARKAYGIMDSNLIAIENYLQSEDARDCYHGMLLAQKEAYQLTNDSTSDGAVPLQ